MPIILFILWMALIGVVTWAVVTYIPMPDAIKKLIIIVVVIIGGIVACAAGGPDRRTGDPTAGE